MTETLTVNSYESYRPNGDRGTTSSMGCMAHIRWLTLRGFRVSWLADLLRPDPSLAKTTCRRPTHDEHQKPDSTINCLLPYYIQFILVPVGERRNTSSCIIVAGAWHAR